MIAIRPSALGCLLVALAVTLTSDSATGSGASPDARTDFGGRWVPDYDRWHGIDYLLELQEAQWIVRQTQGRIDQVVRITQDEESLRIAIDVALPLPTKERVCRFDNRVREERTLLGRPSRVRHYWEDGGTLVHVRELTAPDGRPYTLVARRRLIEGSDAMEVAIVARVPGEPEHHARQVYVRER